MGFWANTGIAVVYFILSVWNDLLSVEWQTARENREPLKGANVSAMIGGIGWIPFVLLWAQDNWQIIVADLLGAWVGSYRGIKALPKSEDLKWPDHL